MHFSFKQISPRFLELLCTDLDFCTYQLIPVSLFVPLGSVLALSYLGLNRSFRGQHLMDSDGAGLFCGILRHFLNRGAECPRILAATHFHEVFRTDLFDPKTLPVTFLHMQVMFTMTNGDLMDSDASSIRDRSDSKYQMDEEEAKTIGPGEKITYLYKCVNEKGDYLMGAWLISSTRMKGGKGAMFRFPCREMCRDLWSPTTCGRKSSIRYVRSITFVPPKVLSLLLLKGNKHTSHLLSIHELGKLLAEEMTDAEKSDLEGAEIVCRKLLACKFDDVEGNGGNSSVKAKLAEILGREG